MFFYISKTLSFLLDPIVWIIIGLFISLFTKNNKLKRSSFILTLFALLILTNPYISGVVTHKWETNPNSKSNLPHCDIGIVLTGITHSDFSPSDQIHFNGSADRITEGIMLLNEAIIEKLIVSGGNASQNPKEIAESIVLERLLKAAKIEDQQYHLETKSRNTAENAKYCAEYLKSTQQDQCKILLITSAFHMRRAQACFSKQGINVIAFPVDFKTSNPEFTISAFIPSSEPLQNWRMLIKEWIGLISYKVAGYI
jgi:uncharacterized SAM-binding protein YcdF (DUF218 family)